MLSSVVVLAVAFVTWAVVHSLLASRFSKRWARQTFGPGADRWYRLAYNLFAGVSFLPILAMLAVLPDRSLYTVPAPWDWLMRTGQLLALAGLGAAFLQTGPMAFAGLAQLQGQEPDDPGPLVVRGLYCRVRHPLYLFSTLLVWLTPAMTVNWLASCLLITLYFYLGSLHEEQRLLAQFGQAYADYRQRVPMLLPRPGRCVPPS